MEKFLNSLTSMRNSAHLTQTEKDRVLSNILKNSVSTTHTQTASPYMFFFSKQAISIGLLVIFTGGIGLTAAADNSLPTSPFLYNIKLNVTEPAQDVLHTTTQAKISWEIEKTQRRFSEATTLAEEGKLTNEIEGKIAIRIKEHVAKASQTAEENLDDVGAKLQTATEIRTVVEVEAQKLEIATVAAEHKQETIGQILDDSATTDAPSQEVAPQTTETEKPLGEGFSIASIAQNLVTEISDQQENHILEIAKTDPVKADEIETALYKKEIEVLNTEADQTYARIKVAFATAEVLYNQQGEVDETKNVQTTEVLPTENIDTTKSTEDLKNNEADTSKINVDVTSSATNLPDATLADVITRPEPVVDLISPNKALLESFRANTQTFYDSLEALKNQKPSLEVASKIKDIISKMHETETGLNNFVSLLQTPPVVNEQPKEDPTLVVNEDTTIKKATDDVSIKSFFNN